VTQAGNEGVPETGGQRARRRAVEAAARARQLRDQLEALLASVETPQGRSREQQKAAVERASERLRLALIASADAHDRAAAAYESHIEQHGDPDGTRAERAVTHRRAALADRALADTEATPHEGRSPD